MQNLWIWKSIDGGLTFLPSRNGITDDVGQTRFIAPFIMDPNDPDTLLAGGASIWYSSDAAAGWAPLRGPIAAQACTGNTCVSALDVAEGDSNVIWAGYENGVISRTGASGILHWVNVGGGPGSPPHTSVVTDIAISPFDSNEVFVTFGGNGPTRVWYTPDAGTTWASRSTGLPQIQVNTVRFHPFNPNWVYIGTDLGLFASEDKGVTWNRTPSTGDHAGPANTEIAELFWQGDFLIAATYGRGMYRTRPFDTVFVDWTNTGLADGSQPHPVPTMFQGVALAGPGTTISIAPGDYNESGPTTFDQRGQVIAPEGAATIR
jgi:hypothetical protein